MPSAFMVEQPGNRVGGAGRNVFRWGEFEHGGLAALELGVQG